MMKLRKALRRMGFPGRIERGYWIGGLKMDEGLPLWRKLVLLRNGFHSDKYVIYGLDQNPMDGYLTDRQRMHIADRNKVYKQLLDNKIVFPALVNAAFEAPVNVGLIVDGRLSPLEPVLAEPSWAELLAHCQKIGGLVLKPFNGDGGKGIIFVTCNDSGYKINQRESSEEGVIARLKTLTNYLITERLAQGEFPESLYPHSSNTMRILTMIDPATGHAFIPTAAQRIGTLQSAPIDNFIQGGLSAPIGIDNGQLGPAAERTTGCQPLVWHEMHPDSGSRIAGRRIPDWPDITDRITSLADRMAYLPIVGWDVMITTTGIAIIEGNSVPGMGVVQMHTPLLRDPRVRRVFGV